MADLDANTQVNVVSIPTDGFFSKWGFGDGDILDDALWDMGFGEVWEKHHDFDHDVLCEVLDRFVVPAVRLNHELTLERIGTIHNPYRAVTFDGKDARGLWYSPELAPKVTPGIVDVPWTEIANVAAEVMGRVVSS